MSLLLTVDIVTTWLDHSCVVKFYNAVQTATTVNV